jgi:hypothetical protein
MPVQSTLAPKKMEDQVSREKGRKWANQGELSPANIGKLASAWSEQGSTGNNQVAGNKGSRSEVC